MSVQHLSDEAVAAFADGVLGGHARDRAGKHVAECPECAYAVAIQREAVWTLRAAPAPTLPSGLMDRLRAVPVSTPLQLPPTSLGPDGSALFPADGSAVPPPRRLFGGAPMMAAAFVPAAVRPARTRRSHPIVATAAAVAVAGALAVASSGRADAVDEPTRAPAGTAVGVVSGPAPSPALLVAHRQERLAP